MTSIEEIKTKIHNILNVSFELSEGSKRGLTEQLSQLFESALLNQRKGLVERIRERLEDLRGTYVYSDYSEEAQDLAQELEDYLLSLTQETKKG